MDGNKNDFPAVDSCILYVKLSILQFSQGAATGGELLDC
jgi:hypothetical protein